MKSKGVFRDSVDPNLNTHEIGDWFELRIMEERMGESCNVARGIPTNNDGRLLVHQFLVVNIRVKKWIKAEKGGATGNDDGGIDVFEVESSEDPEKWKDEKNKASGRYRNRFTTGRINLGVGKEKWTVEKLRSLLGSSDNPDYNLLSANCWNYVNLCARAILKWITDNTKDVQVKTTIEEKVKELMQVERIKPWELLCAWFIPSRDQSQQVLKQSEVRLSATEEKLRKKSRFRHGRVRLLRKVVRFRMKEVDQVQTYL